MMNSCSLPCGIKCTAVMVQMHLSDVYGWLLLTGTMCDGLIQLEESAKMGPNINTF